MTTVNRTHSKPYTLSRRDWFQWVGFGSLGILCSPPVFPVAAYTERAEKADGLPPLNRFPRMVQEYFVKRVRDAEAKNHAIKARIQTRAHAERYVQQVRKKIQQCFGPFPEKTPLHPRTTGVLERQAYRIEKVLFESRPDFLVTANLYVPKGKTFPLPGVVGTCGHSANGKAYDGYQSFAQALARMGYVVLLYDPIGQGERLQYLDDQLKSRIGTGVREHLCAGNQQSLVGEFIGAWRAWDGIRALDYLLTRDEVDDKQIGVTGNSGGGTMTTWLCGVERRWAMAAPSCFVTTLRRNMENELPADTEQCPPNVLALGLDHEDFIAAMAPKPVILLGKEKDYFDVRGLEAVHQRLKKLYACFDAEDNIGLFIGPTYHGYTQENREAMYRWFNGVTHISPAQTEPELTLEKEEDLWCTPKGQVGDIGSRTVFSFTRERSQQLARKRQSLHGEELKNAVKKWLKIPETKGIPDYRILRPLRSRKHPKPHTISYAVETEPGIQAIVYFLTQDRLYSRPPKGNGKALLYVSHRSSDEELRNETFLLDAIKADPGLPVFACDVRGTGESTPNTCGQDFFNPYGPDYFYAVYSLMLGVPYVGQKTFDVLRVLEWMADNGYSQVHLMACGWGAIPAAFAALLSDPVERVTLKNALTSYTTIAESETYQWPLSALIPGVLKEFDLPDCYRELQKKHLRILEPWGAEPDIKIYG